MEATVQAAVEAAVEATILDSRARAARARRQSRREACDFVESRRGTGYSHNRRWNMLIVKRCCSRASSPSSTCGLA